MADLVKVAELEKNPTTKIVFSTTDYKGETYVDVREHIASSTYTGFTKKGLRFHRSQLDEFIVDLQKVRASLAGEGTKPAEPDAG